MLELDNHNTLTEKVEELRGFNFNLLGSISLLHWIGYGLLVLALFDYIEIFFLPDLMNPAWGFQTLGAMVEQVPVPLLGLVLVFYGEKNRRARWEMPVLKVLSWGVLCLGIVYLLLVPWGIFNTVAMQKDSNQQITVQVDQGLEQIQQVKKQLEKTTTPEELETLISSLDRQGRSAKLKEGQQLTKVKENLAANLDQKESQMKSRGEQTQWSQLMKLLKSSVKWNLGALIGGLLFIRIWLDTPWARGRSSKTVLEVD